MTRCKTILFLCCLLASAALFAQPDPFTGTWQLEYASPGQNAAIHIQLQVGDPESGILYPARLSVQSGEFSGTYTLLLVKKNIRQLAIGRNKIPSAEMPFSLGSWTTMLNGILDLSRDNKGAYYLTTERLTAKPTGISMPSVKEFEAKYATTAMRLNAFLKDAEIRLKKINDEPWQYETTQVLRGGKNPVYYGILDTVHTNEREGTVRFPGNKKSSNGKVSVTLNGNGFIDQADLGYKKPTEDILLDTGVNIIALFADEYGRSAASTGKLNLELGDKQVQMDFSTKDDVAATFIVARIIYKPERELQVTGPGNYSTVNDPNRTFIGPKNNDEPDPRRIPGLQTRVERESPEKTLLREAKLVGSTIVTSKQITLAIWDDAVEDGDSISLSLNGKWVIQGLAVKKRPQFIAVTVDPGPNKITFIADNLGSIIPNTSVLEIIDGKERKSFMIDTNLRQNNLINIFYDHNP